MSDSVDRSGAGPMRGVLAAKLQVRFAEAGISLGKGAR
jgi:hypothetical protein